MIRRLICQLRGHQMRHVEVTEGVFWYCGRCQRMSWSPRNPHYPHGPKPLAHVETFRKGSDSTAAYYKQRPVPLPKGPRVTPMRGQRYWIGEDE